MTSKADLSARALGAMNIATGQGDTAHRFDLCADDYATLTRHDDLAVPTRSLIGVPVHRTEADYSFLVTSLNGSVPGHGHIQF